MTVINTQSQALTTMPYAQQVATANPYAQQVTLPVDPATFSQAQTGQELLKPPSKIGTILKNVVVFGGLGAALGFGASFFTLPFIGQPAAPIAAAVGGGIGALIGLVKGIKSAGKKQQAYDQAVSQLQPVAVPETPPAPAAVSSTYTTHAKPKAARRKKVTVRSGDTLAKIAARHHTTWQKLYKANRAAVGCNPNHINVGLKLRIPA